MFKAAVIAAALVAGLIAAKPACADSSAIPADATAVIGALTARTASVGGYSADITLHVALHSFPFLHLTITGRTTYQQPGRYAVTLKTLPAIARALRSVSGDAGDPVVWSRRYYVTVDPGVQAPSGTIVLRMTQKVHGQIDHVEAYVDAASMTISRIEWYYRTGGHIFVDEHYAMVGTALMVDHQGADIDMPGIRASATSDITNYAITSVVAASSR